MADVECRYCRAINDAEEQRCARCLRRLHLAAPRLAPDIYPREGSIAATAAATAPAFESLPGGDTQRENSAPERAAYQSSLFREALGKSNVIPIPTLTPLRSQAGEGSVRRGSPRTSLPRPRRGSDLQQALEFPEAGESGLAMQVDVIYCDAPVALPAHRMIAAAVDTSVALIGLGLFLGVFFLAGGETVLSRSTVPFLLGVAAVIGMFYRCLWCLADGDTPGMRFARLRLVDFDGRRPDREQRAIRQVAGLLSLLSAGLGLVWALVDEENLTWHDHISKTFPTPDV
jgi:uncharacterized RDD family membrane protein YckC